MPPLNQGAEGAASLRGKLNLGDAPIGSLRDFMAERFPSVAVLFANLGGGGPAGVSFVDHLRGPTIVLNLDGKNKNACVRRFSLAHELCHLLLDWNRNQPIATISGYLNESQLDVERRANAFAVRLLCPEKEFVTEAKQDAGIVEQAMANRERGFAAPAHPSKIRGGFAGGRRRAPASAEGALALVQGAERDGGVGDM